MNVTGAWQKFWFSEGPYFDLAVVRIMAVGLQCYLLLLVGLNSLHYTASLPDSLYHPLPMLRILMSPFVGFDVVRPDADFIVLAFWCTLAFGFAALVGLATNFFLLLFAIGNLFLQAYEFSFTDYHHPEAIMMVALFALALAPCGRVLSLDSVLSARRGESSATSVGLLEYSGTDATWAIKFIQCFFSLMYISAVVSKFVVSGWDWANGYTLQYYFFQDGMRWSSELALLAAKHHYPMMLSQIVVLVFQGTYFLIIFFPRLRWFYLPLGLVFHIGIYLTLRAPFPQWVIFYAAYIPWALALQRVVSTQVRVPAATAPSGASTS